MNLQLSNNQLIDNMLSTANEASEPNPNAKIIHTFMKHMF